MEKSSSGMFFFYKWSTFVSMYAGYALLVLDRKSFTFALPTIMKEINLDKDSMGLIASSHHLSYTFSKFLGGIVSDHASAKLLFSVGLALTGILTAGFTAFDTVTAFVIVQFLQGLVQGGVWPSCAKILKKWCPKDQFGTLWSVLSSAMNIACTIGPLIVTYICTHHHWQLSMQTFGFFTVILAMISYIVMVNSPSDIGYDNFDEAKEKGKSQSVGRGSWHDMLQSPFMWVLFSSYLVVYLVRTAALDWAQLFLIEEKGQEPFIGSAFISMLESGGFIGSIVAGIIADRVVAMSKRDSTRGTPRMLVVIGFVVLCIVSLHCIIFTISAQSSTLWISTLAFLLGFGLYGPVSLYGVMAIESAPTHLSGMSHAIVALSANIGAIFSGLPLSIVAGYYNWKGCFIMLEVLLMIILIVKIATRNIEYKMIPTKKKLQ